MLLAYGFLRKVFEVFEKYRTSIDMITTSEVAVSVTIDNDVNLKEIIKELEPFGTVEIDTNHTIVSIVGNEIAETKDPVCGGHRLRVPVADRADARGPPSGRRLRRPTHHPRGDSRGSAGCPQSLSLRQ